MKICKRKKSAICIVLVALLLSAFLLVRPVAAEEPEYQNISVQQAKHMIKHTPDVVILDVRNHSEYEQGHLYGAFLLPLHLIENWDWNWNSTPAASQPYINFLQAHANDTIIVYCKAGSRSAQACQILTEHGLTKVYNMQNGIIAWMQAGYPIYTCYHHVSVDAVDEETTIEIEPWLLYQSSCTSCQNQTCSASSTSAPTNTTVTLIEENENRTVYLIAGMVNGTLLEYTVIKNVLWRNSELEDGFNRTVTFFSTETMVEGISQQVFDLKYTVQHEDFIVTLQTVLAPLNAEFYNGSITLISYEPTGKVAVKSKEVVEFNSSATLSQQYIILSGVAKKMGKVYAHSDDESLKNLAEGYNTMKEEIKRLSRIVKNDLPEYDRVISGVAAAVVGVGLSVPDPEAIQNGGFESGTSYWTVGGSGDYFVSSLEKYSGSYSLLLGYKYAAPVANAYDQAYQLVYIPDNTYDVQFSLKYKLYTEDSASYDKLEVYIAPYGGNPQLVFSTGGSSRGGLEIYGWNSWSTSLDNYRGYSIYVYIAIYNGYDTNYRTYCYLDDVSIKYEEITDCDWEDFLECAWGDYGVQTACGWLFYPCGLAPGPYNPFCWGILICTLAINIYCAVTYCD